MVKDWQVNATNERPKPVMSRILVVLLLLALLGFLLVGGFLMFGQRQVDTILTAFEEALEKADYSQAMNLYRLAQDKALADGWLDRHQEKYRKALTAMEKLSNERLDRIEYRLGQGKRLTKTELEFSSQMAEISATRLISFLRNLCVDYLRGTQSFFVVRNAFDQLANFDNLKHAIGHLPAEFDQMTVVQPMIKSALSSWAAGDYWDAWQQFNNLTKDPAQTGFVYDQLLLMQSECESTMYEPLLMAARNLMEGGRYMSAQAALEALQAVFVDDPAIAADLAVCENNVPKVLVEYFGPIEIISILPLIADAETAFSGGPNLAAVRDVMLTTGEFRRLLEQLYGNHFILIDHDRIYDENGNRKTLWLPENKKPLVLVIEGLNYYASRRALGTNWDLVLDESGNVCATRPQSGQQMVISREDEAIGILDLFVETYRDFSYDGAKGTIAVTGYECLFGKVIHSNQLPDRNKALRDMGYQELRLSAADIADNRREAEAIVTRLQNTGWQFACFTYGLINVRDASFERIQDDTSKWLDQIGALTGPVGFYNYPFGAFLNGSDPRAIWLREQGFRFFCGQGTKAYMYSGYGYLYADKTPISGYSLRNSRTYQLERLLDPSKVYDATLRKDY